MPEINQQKTVKVQAKTLKIHMKVCDQFQAQLLDQDGATIHEQEDGYVPAFMPGPNYGDYLILDIDMDTGMILNWTKPSAEKVEAWVNKEED